MPRWIGLAAFALALLAGGAAAWLLFSLFPCENAVIQDIPSPTGQHRAILFERSCGATTGYSTQVSILGQTESLPDEAGNAVVAEGQSNLWEIEWLDAATLGVRPEGELHRAEAVVDGIEIRYTGN